MATSTKASLSTYSGMRVVGKRTMRPITPTMAAPARARATGRTQAVIECRKVTVRPCYGAAA